jgi:hypothetical protein
MAELVVQGEPLNPATRDAEKKALDDKAVADKKKADEAEKAGKKIEAHQAKVLGADPSVAAAKDVKATAVPGTAVKVATDAALLKDALTAKTSAQMDAEAHRLALGASSESSWDRGHYGEFNRQVIGERNAVVASKTDDAPSLADAAGSRTPAPGPTPGQPQK